MSYFLQFGGQGVPWLKELSIYMADTKMQLFYEVVVQAIQEEVERVDLSKVLNTNFNLRTWLKEPDKAPDTIALSKATISLPMIQATQLAHIEFLHVNNLLRREDLYQNACGAVGHSQGVVAATLLAMCLEGEEYYNAVKAYTKYLFYVGYEAQLIVSSVDPSPEEYKKANSFGEAEPTPMAAILGASYEETEELVERANQILPKDRQIRISLVNSPTNYIVSASRTSLLYLYEIILPKLQSKELKCVYVKTSCPFHSSLLDAVQEPFNNSTRHINFIYQGSDLKLPVYAFSDGRNIQKDLDLRTDLYKELLLRTLYWDKALAPFITQNVKVCLDFGPAKTTQRLTQDTFRKRGVDVDVYALALLKERNRFFQ